MTKPGRPAPSLHLRILGWLIVPLLLMAVVLMLEVYSSAHQSTGRFQDHMLHSYAIGVAEQSLSSGGDLVYLDFIQKTSQGTVFYKVEGPDNVYVAGYSGLPDIPTPSILGDGEPHFFNATYRESRVRVVALRTLVEGRELDGWMTVYVAQPTDEREALVLEQLLSSGLRLGLLILVAGVLAWIAVSQGLKPLTRLERAIGRRSFDDLRTIKVELPRETTNLVASLNDLLTRLSTSIDRNKRFIANASHQLRTPIANLMTQTELALRKSEDKEACAPIERIHASSQHMGRLVGQLLTLAQTEGMDKAQSRLEPLDLIALVRSVTTDYFPRARSKGMDLGAELPDGEIEVNGNSLLLQELLLNLLDNACRYCPEGSEITVRLTQADDTALLSVEDNGPGIPLDQREAALERFARLDEQNKTQGSGLGLAIVKEIADVHHGELLLSAPTEGQGLIVLLKLPSAGQSRR